jgi:hypothetical protein
MGLGKTIQTIAFLRQVRLHYYFGCSKNLFANILLAWLVERYGRDKNTRALHRHCTAFIAQPVAGRDHSLGTADEYNRIPWNHVSVCAVLMRLL